MSPFLELLPGGEEGLRVEFTNSNAERLVIPQDRIDRAREILNTIRIDEEKIRQIDPKITKHGTAQRIYTGEDSIYETLRGMSQIKSDLETVVRFTPGWEKPVAFSCRRITHNWNTEKQFTKLWISYKYK